MERSTEALPCPKASGKNKRLKNLHPSYPTLENEALDKYSVDFYDSFIELVENEDQLFPKNLEKLDE